MQRARMRRARTAALTTAVGLCVVVPLAAASADSSGEKQTYADTAPRTVSSPAPGLDFGTGVTDTSGGPLGSLLPSPTPRGNGHSPAPAASPTPSSSPAATPGESCGRAVRTPDGVSAQTCIEQAAGMTWGRVYYHAPTADAAILVLNVTQPGGSTLSITCQVAAASGDGVCETPQVRDPGTGFDGWSAVSEMAAAEGSRMLLRSGTAQAAG